MGLIGYGARYSLGSHVYGCEAMLTLPLMLNTLSPQESRLS